MTAAERFETLLAQPGVAETSSLAGRVGFLALHGGNLERTTDQIASEAAEACGASLYTVAQPEPMRDHIPSIAFDPEKSDALASFLAHIDIAISVHGYGSLGAFTTVLIGGSNRTAARMVAAELRPRLPSYEFVDRLDDIGPKLRGVHRHNPVNRPRLGGVQIELPPRIRGLSPWWRDRYGTRVSHTDRLIAGLAAAAGRLDAHA